MVAAGCHMRREGGMPYGGYEARNKVALDEQGCAVGVTGHDLVKAVARA